MFDWPAPATVAVVETVTTEDAVVELGYRLRIRATKSGGRRLAYEQLELRSVNGQPVSDKEQAAFARRYGGITPDFTVSAGGEFGAVVAVEDTTRAVLALSGVSDKTLRALADDPAVRQKVAARAGDAWRSWVELWMRPLPPPGASASWPTPDGGRIDVHNRGTGDHPTLVRLEARVVPYGGPLEIRRSAASGEVIAQIDQLAVEVVVETDPTSLRPAFVRTARRSTVSAAGSKAETVETREYRFAWERTDG